MKIIKIIVLKSDIINMIGQDTDYAGTKTETADRNAFHQRVATTESDAVLLARYWQDACASLADLLRSFITDIQFGRETLSMTLEVSEAYDDSLTPAVESGVSAVLAAGITSRWFRFTLHDRADEWEKEASRRFGLLLANLYHRKKPQRKQ